MSNYPFRLQNNFLNSTYSYENEDNNISLKSYDNISSSNEIDNLESDFNSKIMNQLFGVKNKPVFISVLKNKRGRKPKKISRKETHDANTFDNILRKIQTHFLSFMISFINDCIKSLHKNKRMNLKKINYAEKRKIKKSYLEKIKNATINEFIQNTDISIKYKRCNKDINKINLTKLSKISFFKNLFEMNFLELFHLYYNKSQPLDKLFLFNETINLSENTKPFYNLLKAEESNKENFIEIAKMNYINEINPNENDNEIGDCSEDNIYQKEKNNSINLKDDE